MATPDVVSQERVSSLMIIMTMREMPLSEAQLAQLRRVNYERLPNVELALRAKSVDDFMRRAGLKKSNSRR